jgi:hypothetical protein
MKVILAVLMIAFAIPATANARTTCRQQHGGQYCKAKEHRHALRVIRRAQVWNVQRAHVKFHRSYYRGWDIVRLEHATKWERGRLRWLKAQPTFHDPNDVHGAICSYFTGRYCAEAWAVTACESTHSIYDQLGQYLGLFQMGDYARARYGGNYGADADAWSQAKAAWGYFRDSGYDWSPWSCKPDGSVRYPG